MIKLSEVKKGHKVTIKKMAKNEVSNMLMELCFMPNEVLYVENIAPFGDPIVIKISDYYLSIRKEEAKSIWVEIMDNE